MGLLDIDRQATQARLTRDVGRSKYGMLNDDNPIQKSTYGGMYGSLMQDPADKERMDREMWQNTVAMMPIAGMNVWHGSPHIFNKFRMDKIGTGEGAQAYGHGLYLAENPSVAKGYKERLSRQGGLLAKAPRYTVEGKTDGYMDDVIHEIQTAHKGDIDKFIAKTKKDFVSTNDINELKGNPKRLTALYEIRDENIDFARSLKGKKIEEIGSLYKVDLPDDQIKNMLDWDKPLSEQGKHIQNLVKSEHPEQWNLGIKMDKIRNNLKEMADKYGKSGESYKEAIGHAPKKVQKEYQNLLNEFRQAELSMREVKIRTPQMPSSGESIYHSIGAKLGNPNQSMGGFLDAPGASEFLKSKGIPGIKYFDQGSRGGATRTVDPAIENELMVLKNKLVEGIPKSSKEYEKISYRVKILEKIKENTEQGTRNFVVFDENIPKILERNEQPIGGLLDK